MELPPEPPLLSKTWLAKYKENVGIDSKKTGSHTLPTLHERPLSVIENRSRTVINESTEKTTSVDPPSLLSDFHVRRKVSPQSGDPPAPGAQHQHQLFCQLPSRVPVNEARSEPFLARKQAESAPTDEVGESYSRYRNDARPYPSTSSHSDDNDTRGFDTGSYEADDDAAAGTKKSDGSPTGSRNSDRSPTKPGPTRHHHTESSHRPMRSFHSTPDCKTASSLSSVRKTRTRPAPILTDSRFAFPMRISRDQHERQLQELELTGEISSSSVMGLASKDSTQDGVDGIEGCKPLEEEKSPDPQPANKAMSRTTPQSQPQSSSSTSSAPPLQKSSGGWRTRYRSGGDKAKCLTTSSREDSESRSCTYTGFRISADSSTLTGSRLDAGVRSVPETVECSDDDKLGTRESESNDAKHTGAERGESTRGSRNEDKRDVVSQSRATSVKLSQPDRTAPKNARVESTNRETVEHQSAMERVEPPNDTNESIPPNRGAAQQQPNRLAVQQHSQQSLAPAIQQPSLAQVPQQPNSAQAPQQPSLAHVPQPQNFGYTPQQQQSFGYTPQQQQSFGQVLPQSSFGYIPQQQQQQQSFGLVPQQPSFGQLPQPASSFGQVVTHGGSCQAPATAAVGMTNPMMMAGGMNQPTPLMVNPFNMMMINNKHYVMSKLIGRGGSSQVYEAMCPQFGICAVKMVDLGGEEEAVIEGYKNEIELMMRLQDSGRVIKLFDHEYRGSQLIVVMERGETDLDHYFRQWKNSSRILPEMVKFYWRQMLEAVQVLHDAGIVHSDLKPANFLLVAGVVKLIDFGIAKAIQSDRTSVTRDVVMGTLNYLSPEAILDTQSPHTGVDKPKFKLGVKSDIWSLGCILYTMVYNRTPFQHIKRAHEKLQAITSNKHAIPYPEGECDPSVVETLKRCLVRDPRQRAGIEELLNHAYLTNHQPTTVAKTAA